MSDDDTTPLCGRILIGRGDDTSDPPCVRPRGHIGRCLAKGQLAQDLGSVTDPTAVSDPT